MRDKEIKGVLQGWLVDIMHKLRHSSPEALTGDSPVAGKGFGIKADPPFVMIAGTKSSSFSKEAQESS